MIFGTPEYMSPEQAQGSTPDHRVDVYAVGCIMYHMLTGQVPFTADNFMGILTKHLLEAPVPPRQRRPDLEIPEDVEAICMRAMEKDRDKRYPDMDAFYRALGASGDLAFEPSQVFVAPRPPKASLKYPTLASLNPEARASRTAIAPSGTFEDERLGIAGAVIALRPSGKPAAPEAPAAAAPNPAAVPPAPAAVAPAPPPAPTTAPKPAAAVEPAAPAADAPKSSRSRRHRSSENSDEAKADPLHRQIAVPAETPAEIKPFPTN
jgi:serine/threonine-protein kinase